MKRGFSYFLIAIFLLSSLCACADNSGVKRESGAAKDGKIQIITTIFPEYDWVRNIVGDSQNVEITMLLDNGVDLHSYQPNVNDVMKISNCDLFIYVGGESDEWVDDVLRQATNDKMKVIDLLEVLGDAVKTEEVVEGMEHDHDHGNEEHEGEDQDHEDGEDQGHDDHDHEGGHSHGEELDEHVWLSLKNASALCGVIADALCELDAANKEVYKTNLENYRKELNALDLEYADAVKGAKYKTLLFGDRFPFRYLTDDYGLTYYAAFSGCSAESEASFETVTFLAGKMDELGLPAIMTIEGKNHKIAEAIRNATGAKDQEILTLDSLQSTTSKDVADGASYLKSMKANLEILKQALK